MAAPWERQAPAGDRPFGLDGTNQLFYPLRLAARGARGVLPRLTTVATALALLLLILLILGELGLIPWSRLVDVPAPWSSFLNADSGPATVRFLGAMSAAYLAFVAAAALVCADSAMRLLGSVPAVVLRRLGEGVALSVAGIAVYLLGRLGTDLVVRFELSSPVALTLPTILVFGLLGVGAPGAVRHLRHLLARPLRILRTCCLLLVAGAVVFSVDLRVDGGRPWEHTVLQPTVVQLALLACELLYLLLLLEVIVAARDDALSTTTSPVRRRLVTVRGFVAAGIVALPLIAALAGALLPATYQASAATAFTDRDGTLLYVQYPQGMNRLWLSEIPHNLVISIESTEDPGIATTPFSYVPVNPARLAAVFASLAGHDGVEGGASGIPAQTCKLVLGRPASAALDRLTPRTLPGRGTMLTATVLGDKLFEFACGWGEARGALVRRVARSDETDPITLYANLPYVGRGAYGMQSASYVFFGKPAAELAIHEAALLAGLLQSPSALDPWVNPEGARERRNQVLRAMLRRGHLTFDEHRRLVELELGVLPEPGVLASAPPPVVAYLLDRFDTGGLSNLSRRGLTVRTSIDSGEQAALEQALGRVVATRSDSGVTGGGAIILDPRSGEVIAWAETGLTARTPDLVRGLRVEPGSTIKPLIYSCALLEGVLGPDETLDSSARDIDGQHIVNADPGAHGMQPAADLLKASSNVAAAELVERLGALRMSDCLERNFGLGGLDPDLHGVRLGLGVAPAPMLDLALGYAALASGRRDATPSPLLAVFDRQRRPLFHASALDSCAPGDPTFLAATEWVTAALLGVGGDLGMAGYAAKTGSTDHSSYGAAYGADFVITAWLGDYDPATGLADRITLPGSRGGAAVVKAMVTQEFGPGGRLPRYQRVGERPCPPSP